MLANDEKPGRKPTIDRSLLPQEQESMIENFDEFSQHYHERTDSSHAVKKRQQQLQRMMMDKKDSSTVNSAGGAEDLSISHNICDDSLGGFAHTLDEFQISDRHKRVPRAFFVPDHKTQMQSRVNVPTFKLSTNPFSSKYFVSSSGAKYQFSESSQQTTTQHKQVEEQKNALKQLRENQNGNFVPVKMVITTGGESNNNNNNNNNQAEEVEDCDADSELIMQIADQIPELLEKSEMRDYLLTPSLIDGFKQQPEKLETVQIHRGGTIRQPTLIQQQQQLQQGENNILNEQDRCYDSSEKQNFDLSTPIKRDGTLTNNSNTLAQKQSTLRVRHQHSASFVFPSVNHLDIDQQSEVIENLEFQDDYSTKVVPVDEHVLFTLVKREFEFHRRLISKEEIQKILTEFKFIEAKDEPRVACANKEGGKECKDKKIKECLRNIGTEIIKSVGRKILSGSFNLTQVSFPIRAMIPQTILEKTFFSTCLFPLYVNKAAATNDLVERFKLLICATLGNFYINCGFMKPLNPILGETCRAVYLDGTKLYAEQISHHPPISYFLVYGPENSYCMYGNYNQEVNAGLNSVKIKNRGSRHIRFKDGQCISYNFAKESYNGSFIGTMKVESKGMIQFKDEANGIVAEIEIGNVKKKPTDYLAGTIKRGGTVVSTISGTYMGFMEFNSVRYWDFRHVMPYEPIIVKSPLGSDQSRRMDKEYLLAGDITAAQKEKENLENLQRADAKLRKKYAEAAEKAKKKESKMK